MAAFKDCSSLVTTNFIERAEIMETQAFSGCGSLNGNLNLSAKIIKTSAFDKCSDLGPNINVENAENIESGAFRECNEINGIVYAQQVSGGANVFASRTITALLNGGKISKETDLSSANLATLTKEGYIFAGWYDNEDFNGNAVTVPEKNKTYYAKWIEKTVPTISFKDDFKLDKNYDGKAVSISEKDYTVTVGAGEVTFNYQVKNGDTWSNVDSAPINAGTYQVKAVVAENDNYKGAETDWKEFTINKANPTYTLPTDLVIGKGKTLATVTLPNGFTWVDETTIAGELGTHEFEAVYTPEDTTNYKTVDVMISVEVVPNTSLINHAPEIEVSDKTLTVGEAFDPMENVIVKDKEDSANDLVVDVTHNVDTSKAGVYEVTYTVTDTKGATVTKTITVTVKEKNVDTPATPEKPNNTTKPDNTTKPNKTDTPQTGDMTNLGVFASMLAGSSGALAVLLGKRRKNNKKND